MNAKRDNSLLNSDEMDPLQVSKSALIKEKILSGEYQVDQKRGRSRAWDVFAEIKDENGVVLENIVVCKMCKNVYRFSKGTSNLCRHKCFKIVSLNQANTCGKDVDDATQQKTKQILTECTLQSCQLFNLVNDPGFRKWSKHLISLGAQFGENINLNSLLPDSTVIPNSITKLYDLHFEEAKNEILNAKIYGYGLTADINADNYLKASYMSLTIHYIKDGVLMNRLLAFQLLRGVIHSDHNIMETISKILHTFGCDLEEDNPIIVTDNMTPVSNNHCNIYCINHLLNNVIERIVEEVPELSEMVNKCYELVKYLKESGIDANVVTTIESNCTTRWNAIFYLLKAVEWNWYCISEELKVKNEFNQLQGINIEKLTSVVNILSPLEKSSKKLEADDYPTLHLTIPHIHRLKKICVEDINDLDIVKNIKNKLLELTETMLWRNITMFHKVALFLFPPTNKLSQFTEIEKRQTIEECKQMMKKFTNPNIDFIKTEEEFPSCISDDNDIFADFVQPEKQDNSDEQISKEIIGYRNITINLSDDFNVVQWWNLHRAQFPLLFKVSCRILATPASIAASERAFAKGRNLIAEERNAISINSEIINKIMFLHSNLMHTSYFNDFII